MQKLFSLALLAALVGGGWKLFNQSAPPEVKSAVETARQGLGQVFQGQGQGGQPGYPPGQQPPPYQQPQQPQYAPQPSAQYAAPTLPPKQPGTIRIATFNIQVFGDSKASKDYVMRTLAAIVQQFDLVAIQEIRTQDNYLIDKFLQHYVNAGGRQYNRVVGPRLGRTRSTEQYAYVYDTATIELNPQSVYTVNDSRDDLLHREPLVAQFRARAGGQSPFMFMLVNTHTDPDEAVEEMDALAQVVDVVRRYSPGEDDVILLGDLNTNVPSPRRRLARGDMGRLGTMPGAYPVIHAEPTNTRRSKLHDNIVINSGATTEFTGNAGVFDFERIFGLTREQALQVSDHLPVWAEFSVQESSQPGRFARTPGTQR